MASSSSSDTNPPPAQPYHRPAGPKHNAFVTWATSRGITFSKITPASFPSSGLGIVSTSLISGSSEPSRKDRGKDFPDGEEIAFTPTASLLTRENLSEFTTFPDRVKGRLHELSTHALLAAAIANEKDNERNVWRPWIEVFPSLEEFRLGLPILWTKKEQDLLPPSALSLLESQKEKFKCDWKKVRTIAFEFTREDFLWAWLVVNTRTLFYKLDTPEYKDAPRTDCLALCPFIDYFNHCDEGCKVTLSPAGYTVTTTVVHPANSQIFVSYGYHSNDFLLVEYGFVLSQNKWDDVLVDSYILPSLSKSKKRLLEDEGFLGNYTFDESTFCYRTQAAVRMLLIDKGSNHLLDRWYAFLSGEEDGGRDQAAVDNYLLGVLKKLEKSAEEALEEIARLREGNVKRLLFQRWEQIKGMIVSIEDEMRR